MDVLFFLILGHFAGDYALQSDYIAINKKNSLAILTYHVLLYILTIWITFLCYSLLYHPGLLFETSTLIFLAALFVQHWLQDYLKSHYRNGSKQAYYADQLVHLIILYIYRIFVY